MKRSEINTILQEAMLFIEQHGFVLPPWAHWTPEQWQQNRLDAGSIIQNSMGWDVTDFGSGDFPSTGLTAFTLRNGSGDNASRPYCEKLIVVRENQVTPTHHHEVKQEDIINRGGGNLIIELWNVHPDKRVDKSGDVTCLVNDLPRTIPAGGKVVLEPGMSVFLRTDLYHAFYAEPGAGSVLVGEVSSSSDDDHDNFFVESEGRFPAIQEDEPPLRLLVCDYAVLRQR